MGCTRVVLPNGAMIRPHGTTATRRVALFVQTIQSIREISLDWSERAYAMDPNDLWVAAYHVRVLMGVEQPDEAKRYLRSIAPV